MSDSTLVTCMAYEFETMEWQITAESSDFEQNIDPDTVQRSASDAEEVAQGITLRSDFTTSFTSPQQNSGSSTLTISSSFPLEGFFTFSCTAIRSSSSNGGISSSIQSWSVTIFIGDSDVTSESECNVTFQNSYLVPLLFSAYMIVVYCSVLQIHQMNQMMLIIT